MERSILLAQLIGPTLAVIGLSLAIDPPGFRKIANEFLASPALIFLAGLLALVPGLAIVLTHNVWTADWRIIISILGWLAVIGGAIRILLPGQVARIGSAVMARLAWTRVAGIVILILGAVLTFFGYVG